MFNDTKTLLSLQFCLDITPLYKFYSLKGLELYQNVLFFESKLQTGLFVFYVSSYYDSKWNALIHRKNILQHLSPLEDSIYLKTACLKSA